MRHEAQKRPGGESPRKIANALSYLLHPVVLMTATAAVISHHCRNNALLSFLDIALLLSGLFPGLAYIYVKKQRGAIGHYHLLLIRERSVVLPMLLAGMGGSLAIAAAIRAPAIITLSLTITLLEGVGATVISRFWKISLHAAVAMGCAALLASISRPYAIVLGILAILVGASRVIVNHHTPLQVIAGWIYGFVLTRLLLLWFDVS